MRVLPVREQNTLGMTMYCFPFYCPLKKLKEAYVSWIIMVCCEGKKIQQTSSFVTKEYVSFIVIRFNFVVFKLIIIASSTCQGCHIKCPRFINPFWVSIIDHWVILLRCVGKYAVAHKEVNYKMGDSKRSNTSMSTFVPFLLVVYFMFSSKVDADLLVNPTLIKQELQSIATDALGVNEMQVSRILRYIRLVLVG